MKKNEPTYDLDEIKDLLRNEETRAISDRDRVEAVKLGYADDNEMVARVLKLSSNEFYKTMESRTYSSSMQDVYFTYDGNKRIYIKLQISFNGKGCIISFKEA